MDPAAAVAGPAYAPRRRPSSPRESGVAALTVGHSGADLEKLLNEAAIAAVQARSLTFAAVHVEQARDKVVPRPDPGGAEGLAA